MPSEKAEGRERFRSRCGKVVLYSGRHLHFEHRHEVATRIECAKRLAALKGYAFAGEEAPLPESEGPFYVVPSDTLVGAEAAALGIRDENDLFGGVVPYPFVATKVISHPLISVDAAAPTGWSHEFGPAVQDVVLRGYSAFAVDDARRAGELLFAHGPVRIKRVSASGGKDQTVVSDAAELGSVLRALPIGSREWSEYGLVLEENLDDVTTYSVGQVRVADLVASYCGTQRVTSDNFGETAYGGSELFAARGGFDALLAQDLSPPARLTISQARKYDAAVQRFYPGTVISRRNYDVAAGKDATGQARSGVLEQSWRVGGASPAEIAALEALRAIPGLEAVRVSSVEVYGEDVDPPPGCTVYFRGVDEIDGPLMKYALVEV